MAFQRPYNGLTTPALALSRFMAGPQRLWFRVGRWNDWYSSLLCNFLVSALDEWRFSICSLRARVLADSVMLDSIVILLCQAGSVSSCSLYALMVLYPLSLPSHAAIQVSRNILNQESVCMTTRQSSRSTSAHELLIPNLDYSSQSEFDAGSSMSQWYPSGRHFVQDHDVMFWFFLNFQRWNLDFTTSID
jgi:hypothetical protein